MSCHNAVVGAENLARLSIFSKFMTIQFILVMVALTCVLAVVWPVCGAETPDPFAELTVDGKTFRTQVRPSVFIRLR